MRPGRAADHSPPSSAVVMEEQSYTSTHPLGHTGPVTRSLYLYVMSSIRQVHAGEIKQPVFFFTIVPSLMMDQYGPKHVAFGVL